MDVSTAAAAAAAKLLQSCPTLCDPTDGSPPVSPSLGLSNEAPKLNFYKFYAVSLWLIFKIAKSFIFISLPWLCSSLTYFLHVTLNT